MDSLAIQRSLTILEDRYRELREIGEQRFESFESTSAALQAELAEAREENELCLLQLHQMQEELERALLESKFLRTKLDERDVLISQYQRALNRLKGVCLHAFQSRRLTWPRPFRAGKSPQSNKKLV